MLCDVGLIIDGFNCFGFDFVFVFSDSGCSDDDFWDDVFDLGCVFLVDGGYYYGWFGFCFDFYVDCSVGVLLDFFWV